MSFNTTDPPDPGSVDTDDRCPSCSARDGESCDADCRCGACLDDLDPELYCLKHGKELPMGPYGVRYGGCEDCEPGEPDYDAAAAMAARRDPTHPDNVEMRKLKGWK